MAFNFTAPGQNFISEKMAFLALGGLDGPRSLLTCFNDPLQLLKLYRTLFIIFFVGGHLDPLFGVMKFDENGQKKRVPKGLILD